MFNWGTGKLVPPNNTTTMLLETMTKNEVLNELKRIDSWLADRKPGIMKKYERLFKPKNAKDRMLGVSEYTTPCSNKVHVVWSTAVRGIVWLEFAFYVELETPNGKAYVKALFNTRDGRCITDACVYTAHAIQRLKERQGIDFKQLMELEYKESRSLYFTLPYTYKGKESLATPFGVVGLWVTVMGKWGLTYVTYVSRGLCGVEQLESMYVARKTIEQYQNEKDEYVTKDGNNCLSGLSRKQRRLYAPR